jgi:hypothetical protein
MPWREAAATRSRFAAQASDVLAAQIRHLAWPERCRTLDGYFTRQAAAMLGTAEIGRAIVGQQAASKAGADRLADYAAWWRTIVTTLMQSMPGSQEVLDPHQALTCLLARDWRFARAAAAWVRRHGMAPVAGTLRKLPGYTLVLAATGPEDGMVALLEGIGTSLPGGEPARD